MTSARAHYLPPRTRMLADVRPVNISDWVVPATIGSLAGFIAGTHHARHPQRPPRRDEERGRLPREQRRLLDRRRSHVGLPREPPARMKRDWSAALAIVLGVTAGGTLLYLLTMIVVNVFLRR